MTDSPCVPNARCYMKSGGYYMLEAESYPDLAAAWTTGKAFFSGTTTDGDLATIKLADVECIQFCTIESQERFMERTKAEKRAADPDSFE